MTSSASTAQGKRVLSSRWLFSTKDDTASPQGIRFRARLVARGDMQMAGGEVFAPVVNATTGSSSSCQTLTRTGYLVSQLFCLGE